jgi:hypothetical protein
MKHSSKTFYYYLDLIRWISAFLVVIGHIRSILFLDFSHIEKIAISTSTTVVGQNVGEYIFWDKNNVNGSGSFDDIGADFKNILQGVICY